jgi:tetratricopeptide (TPR) repeat protein
VDAPEDLASLLVSGERAAFHGTPAAAVAALEQAVALARSQDRAAERSAAGWLLGVALGAEGRYGGALTVLSPLVDAGRAAGAGAEARLFAALSAATIASVHRQLGRHAVARASDLEALTLSEGSEEAAFDAVLGLASDAVGLGELDEATARLAEAERLVPPRADEWWRQRVRLGWAAAEVSLLDGDPDAAVGTALEAVDRADRARAPRHVAKGLLILGLAQVSGGTIPDPVPAPAGHAAPDGAAPGARGALDAGPAGTLRRAATLAESLGTLPLVWPSRALLGALVADQDPEESARSLSAARSAVLAIAGDLPPGVRAEFLGRPDLAALLQD